MSSLSVLHGESLWRSRQIRYVTGDWDSIRGLMPEFGLVPFTAGPDEPANPFLLTVMRQPLSAMERPIPVGVVSQTYSLASHRHVAALCRQGLLDAGMDCGKLRYQLGLSELGEWMNFRIYLPETYSFTDVFQHRLDLRLECFNSVDGSSRLVILFGWLRFVCSNGMVIGDTRIEIKERHGQTLDLAAIPERIRPALQAIEADRARMRSWEGQSVAIADISAWADGIVAERWGKRAAARVFHISDVGRDIEIEDPFASGNATQKPVRYLGRVPGSPERATSKYDVAQALSFVATRRNDAEERVAWQAEIPNLLDRLPMLGPTRMGRPRSPSAAPARRSAEPALA